MAVFFTRYISRVVEYHKKSRRQILAYCLIQFPCAISPGEFGSVQLADLATPRQFVQFRRYLYWQARLFIMAQDREWWSRQLHISRDGSFRLSNKSTQALLCILSCKQQVLSSFLSYRVACCPSSFAPVYYITLHRLSQIRWKLFWSHLFWKIR